MQRQGLKLIKSKELELQETIIINTLSNSRPQVQTVKDEDIAFLSFNDAAKSNKKKKLKV